MNLKITEGIRPKIILEIFGREYFHEARRLVVEKGNPVSERVSNIVAPILARAGCNYQFMLEELRGSMPTKNEERLLQGIISELNFLWNNAPSEPEEVFHSIDRAYRCYSALIKALGD